MNRPDLEKAATLLNEWEWLEGEESAIQAKLTFNAWYADNYSAKEAANTLQRTVHKQIEKVVETLSRGVVEERLAEIARELKKLGVDVHDDGIPF